MVTQNTVLILGAGASIPFGFPSGPQLKGIICNDIERKLGMYKSFEKWWPEEIEDLEEFVQALKHSGQYSVDAFLEHRTEFIRIGKRAIAFTLLAHESSCKSHMYNIDPEFNNWYQYLFSKLTGVFEEFEQNKLSILTFNYDRSLGYYILEALKNTYNRTPLEISNVFHSVPIVHLHGQLGPYDGAGLPKNVDRQKVKVAGDQISIVHENLDNYRGMPPFFDPDFKLVAAQV